MKMLKIGGLFALLAFALSFPWVFPNPAVTSIAVYTLIFAIAVIGWNIFSGYTGYLSLGHIAFYGLGAYSLALLCQKWHIQGGYTPFLFIPLAGLAASVWALPFGWFALGTRRHVFVVITLAFVVILQLLAYNLPMITAGSQGMYLPIPPWSGDVFNIPFYYAGLILVFFALCVSWWIYLSKFGLGLRAIRNDEERLRSLGINTDMYKLIAYVISAFFVGTAGALYAYYAEFINPASVFAPVNDVTIALMAFLGGVGTLWGPFLGALIIEPFQQYLTLQFGENGLNLVLYGILYLIIILLLPEGIVPALRRMWTTRENIRNAITKTTHLVSYKDKKEFIQVKKTEKG